MTGIVDGRSTQIHQVLVREGRGRGEREGGVMGWW